MAKNQKPRRRQEWKDATKEKQNAWKRENRMKCAADVPRHVGLAFRDYCSAHGKTVSAALAEYIYSVVGDKRAAAVSVDPSDAPTDQDGFSPSVVPLDQSPSAVKLTDCAAVGDVSAAAAVIQGEMAENPKNGAASGKMTRPEPCGRPDSPSNCTNSQDFPAKPWPDGSRARPGVGNSPAPVVPGDTVPPVGPAAPAPAQDQTQAPAQPSTRTHTGNRRTPTHPQVHAPARADAPTPGEKPAPENPPAEGPREDDLA